MKLGFFLSASLVGLLLASVILLKTEATLRAADYSHTSKSAIPYRKSKPKQNG